jgi:hypothetical protein
MSKQKEIWEELQYQKMVLEHPSAYKRDPDQFNRAFKSLCKFPAIRSAAQLEKVIVKYLLALGHSASKVSTQGTWVKGKKGVGMASSLGKAESFDTGRYIPGGGRKGASDISSTIYGITVEIEVKFSKGDRLSKEQIAYGAEIQKAGGFFMVAKNFDDFYHEFKDILDHPKMVLMKSMMS